MRPRDTDTNQVLSNGPALRKETYVNRPFSARRRLNLHKNGAFCEFGMVKTPQNHLCVVRVSTEIGDSGS
jgi:hypothetical protein